MKRLMMICVCFCLLLCGCGDVSKPANEGNSFINIRTSYYKNGICIGKDKTMYLDFDTMETSPLCAVPNCMHNDANCLAKNVTQMPIFYNEYVYYFESNRGDVKETPDGQVFFIDSKLKKASLDSSKVEIVCEFDDCVPNINYDAYVLHNNELYFIGDDYNPRKDMYGNYGYGNSGGNHFLCSINLDTGKYNNYGSVYDGDKEYEAANYSSGCIIYGIYHDKMYLRYSFLKEMPENDDIPNFTRIVFEYDFETKELKESDLPPSYYMTNEIYTYFDENTKDFHILKDDDNLIISLKEECPNGPPTIISILNNKCFLSTLWFDLSNLQKHTLGDYSYYYPVKFNDGNYVFTNGEKAAVLSEDELLALDKE